jgi:hypothetical protein
LTEYCVKVAGPRRAYGDYISFLWGDNWDCDTDGDAKSTTDHYWTELTIINRSNVSERVDVDPSATDPLTLTVRSEFSYLAARLAYALAVTTGGTLSASPDGPAIPAEALISQMGDFDVAVALKRLYEGGHHSA